MRFKIQDLIDSYEKDWKFEIYHNKMAADNDGFQTKYVPKNSIIKPNQLEKGGKRSRSRRGSSVGKEDGTIGFIYQPKNKANGGKPTSGKDEKPKQPQGLGIYNLLKNLKPDAEADSRAEESLSDDEEANRIVDRKISMNTKNVVGTNFEKYNDLKPTPEIKRKIANLFMEYNESLDAEHATEEFLDICTKTGTEKFMVIGYILNNSFSQDPKGQEQISSLVIDHFYLKGKLFNSHQMVER